MWRCQLLCAAQWAPEVVIRWVLIWRLQRQDETSLCPIAFLSRFLSRCLLGVCALRQELV